MLDNPGAAFFMKPDGLLEAYIWDCCILMQMFIGQFFLTGSHSNAVAHTWYDWVLTKHFWKKTFNDNGMATTEKLGEWDGKALKVFGDESLYEDDLVIKLPDSFLGIGDSFLKHGKDFKTASDIRKLLTE